ncbi:MAG TPA: SlyX family protein [Planctomycetaceae bacterium]
MTDDRSATDRLTAIESLLMHVQHDLEQIHEAVVGQRRDIDALRRELDRLRGHVERLELGPESRDPKLEKPPHY